MQLRNVMEQISLIEQERTITKEILANYLITPDKDKKIFNLFKIKVQTIVSQTFQHEFHYPK